MYILQHNIIHYNIVKNITEFSPNSFLFLDILKLELSRIELCSTDCAVTQTIQVFFLFSYLQWVNNIYLAQV